MYTNLYFFFLRWGSSELLNHLFVNLLLLLALFIKLATSIFLCTILSYVLCTFRQIWLIIRYSNGTLRFFQHVFTHNHFLLRSLFTVLLLLISGHNFFDLWISVDIRFKDCFFKYLLLILVGLRWSMLGWWCDCLICLDCAFMCIWGRWRWLRSINIWSASWRRSRGRCLPRHSRLRIPCLPLPLRAARPNLAVRGFLLLSDTLVVFTLHIH